MKEITKVIKVYRFDELSEEARQKACQQVGDRMTDNTFWYSDVFDLFIKQCASYGMTIDENDIQFSGFGSQGDGASFTCDNIDRGKLLKSLGIKIEEKVLDYIYDVNIIRTSYRAFHEQTVHVQILIDEDALEEEEEEGIIRDINDIADTLEFKLEELKDALCQQLYTTLRQEYDYFHSSEYVEELAYNNDMLFLANGLVYDWGE